MRKLLDSTFQLLNFCVLAQIAKISSFLKLPLVADDSSLPDDVLIASFGLNFERNSHVFRIIYFLLEFWVCSEGDQNFPR